MTSAPDLEIAVTFLDQLRSGGPWVLTAIVPDGSTETVTARTAEKVRAFVREHNPTKNIYYSVNRTRTAMSKKAAKTDIAAIEYALADLDPADGETSEQAKARYLDQLNNGFDPQPTAVVDSGNGIQCLWRLQEPIALGKPIKAGKDDKGRDVFAFSPEDQAKIADVEARIAGIMLRLGAKAGTQNIDRILRLPGTINHPNAKKLRAGRVACPATLMRFNGAAYPLSAFPPPDGDNRRAEPSEPGTPDDGGQHARQADDLEDLVLLDEKVAEQLRMLIKQGSAEELSFESRSEGCLYVACELLRAGKSDEVILGILLDRANGISKHCYDQDNPHRAARRTLDAALKSQKRALPPIKIVDGEIARAVDEAEQALIAGRVPVMVRAGMLVQPITDRRPAADGSQTEVTILGGLNQASLTYLLNKYAATFVRYDKRGKRWRQIDPPGPIATTLLSKGRWQLPKVTGVVTAPTMRPDGSILSEPGYDAATQLWHASAPDLHLPAIPDSRAAAEAALALLKELLAEFEFVDEGLDQAVALAALMTPVLRGACDVVPLFVILAHAAASGKSFLSDIANTIVRGQKCPVITAPESQEEMEKRLGAIILEGAQIISLDNCSHDLGGDLLCQITERPLIRIRILGKSEAPECEWRGTVLANGNNILLMGDMTRRALLCNLDPKMERPELRRFRFNPIERVMADRGAYVAAALTIARAYLASGKQVESDPIASFMLWSRVVREPLIWLGEKDPVKSMEQARATDPERTQAQELIEHWARHLKLNRSYTAREIIDAALFAATNENAPEFHDLLLVRCGWRERIEPKRVGNWLMRIRGQIHCGHYRIDLTHESSHHGNRYRLVDLREQQPLPGL